ncbi:hypothetical protein ACH434_01640 [Lysinibacillus fusiformis]|uniref:hypothetical protein n=1 Tax=Lysinibacillus fusiformis TaxID=28031 RepID=UPI0037927360
MLKRVFSLIFLGVLLLSTFNLDGNKTIEVAAATSAPIKDTITLTVKFPDTIGEGFGVEPTDPEEIHRMVDSQGQSHPYRTGWSAIQYTCARTDTPYISGYDYYGDPIWDVHTVSGWRQGDDYSSIDSHVPHQPAEVKKEIVQQFGQEMYDLAEAAGALFYYDDTTPVPARFLTGDIGEYNKRVNGTTGRYSIYYKDSTYTGQHCQNGEKAYFYRNNDFFVTATFDVEWVEPGDKQGTGLGRAYWELERKDKNGLSEVAVSSSFKGEYDKHVAVRNIKHTVDLDTKHVEQEGPIEFYINAKQVQNKDMQYAFEYEYTNKKIGWVCTGAGEEQRCHWDDRPDWRAVQKFELNGSIPVDHQQGKAEKSDKLDGVLVKKWVVGREDKYGPLKESKAYYEQYSRAEGNVWQDDVKLKTQTTLPMTPGKFMYSVELPSGKHKDGDFYPLKKTQSSGTYQAAELDESLQAEFADGVQLQQKVLTDKGMKAEQRQFESEFVSDMFFTASGTGFMSGYNYAEKVKQAIKNDQALPSFSQALQEGTAKGEAEFVQYTNGVPFEDDWVFTKSEEDFPHLQRYSLPVTPNSELLPNETYKNQLELVDMGLSDLSFTFDQSFSFEHFLFGSGYDDAWIIEQPESRFPVTEYETVELTHEQVKALAEAERKHSNNKIHNFRFVDRTFPDKVREIRGAK